MRKAFYLAKLESRPIMLSAPMDVQQKEFDDDDAVRDLRHADAVARSAAGPRHARKARRHHRRQPRSRVILVGRGAMWSGAGDAVLKLAERIGALIAPR